MKSKMGMGRRLREDVFGSVTPALVLLIYPSAWARAMDGFLTRGASVMTGD
jgi:hypothetical protein